MTCNVLTGFITDSEKDEDETAYSSRGGSTNRSTKEREASQRTLDLGTYEDEVMASLVRDVRTQQRLKTEEDLKRHNKRVHALQPQAKSVSKATEASNQERKLQILRGNVVFGPLEFHNWLQKWIKSYLK